MQRRDYLATTGTMAVAFTSGIGQVSAVSTQDGRTTQTDQFELVEVEAPDEVDVMTPFTYSFTVANTGDDAEFWTYLIIDAWGEEQSVRLALDIPAGEEATAESNTAHIPYLGTARYTLREFDESFSIEAVTAYRGLGEEWRSPEDMVMRVNDIDFTDTYEYRSRGDTTEESAPAGSQWVFVWLYARNAGVESARLPWESDINILNNDRQFEEVYIRKEEDAYTSDTVEPGIEREGWIAYEVPAELELEDIEVSYTADDPTGEWTARWVDADQADNNETENGSANGGESE